jgi:hypothetical protein
MTMFCQTCGTENDDNNFRCTKCGTELRAAQAPAPVQPSPSSGTLGGLIPKNQSALVAYYLGIFAIIPVLGILLGITAFVFGLKGLRYANENPQAKGKAHAWVGIIVGGFFGFGYLILTLIVIASAN